MFNPKAKIPAPSNTLTGNVSTHASSRLRSVSICNPEWFAAIAPLAALAALMIAISLVERRIGRKR